MSKSAKSTDCLYRWASEHWLHWFKTYAVCIAFGPMSCQMEKKASVPIQMSQFSSTRKTDYMFYWLSIQIGKYNLWAKPAKLVEENYPRFYVKIPQNRLSYSWTYMWLMKPTAITEALRILNKIFSCMIWSYCSVLLSWEMGHCSVFGHTKDGPVINEHWKGWPWI